MCLSSLFGGTVRRPEWLQPRMGRRNEVREAAGARGVRRSFQGLWLSVRWEPLEGFGQSQTWSDLHSKRTVLDGEVEVALVINPGESSRHFCPRQLGIGGAKENRRSSTDGRRWTQAEKRQQDRLQ